MHLGTATHLKQNNNKTPNKTRNKLHLWLKAFDFNVF